VSEDAAFHAGNKIFTRFFWCGKTCFENASVKQGFVVRPWLAWGLLKYKQQSNRDSL
jgi:hypothetical protein